MNTKRIIALLLAAVMVLALAGCAADTTIEAYTEDDMVTADSSSSGGIDLQAGFETYTPDTTVFYVNGDAVSWQELYYEIVYYANYLAQQEDTTLTDWNQACMLFTDDDGNYYSYGAVVLSNAVSMLVQYHVMYNKLTELGCVVTDEVQNYVDTCRQTAIDDNFDGDEDAFNEYLDSMYCTRELWDWFNTVDGMYAYEGFDLLYGDFGSNYPDEDVLTYAEGDEDGAWTQYVNLKLIEVTAGASDEATSDETAMTPEEMAEEINNSSDKTAAYDELYAKYNEDEELNHYTTGRCIYQGDMDDAVYDTALQMETNTASVVTVGDISYVILKVDIEPDAGVYFDETDNTMYTLRYYAAWQAYSDLINGDDGWLSSAETEWAEGFENFSIAALFS